MSFTVCRKWKCRWEGAYHVVYCMQKMEMPVGRTNNTHQIEYNFNTVSSLPIPYWTAQSVLD